MHLQFQTANTVYTPLCILNVAMVSCGHRLIVVGVFGCMCMITTVVCQTRQRTGGFRIPSFSDIIRQSSQLENAAREMGSLSNLNLPTPPEPRFGQSGSSGELLGAANIPGGQRSNGLIGNGELLGAANILGGQRSNGLIGNGELLGAANIPGSQRSNGLIGSGELLGAANIPGSQRSNGPVSNGELLGAANIPGVQRSNGLIGNGELLGAANIPGMIDQTQQEQFIPRATRIPNTRPQLGTIPQQSWNDIQSIPRRPTSGQNIFHGGNVHRDANTQSRGRPAGVDLTIDNRVPPDLGMPAPGEHQLFDPLSPTGGLPLAVSSLVDVPLTGRGAGPLAIPASRPQDHGQGQTHIDFPGEHGNVLDIPVVHMSNDPPPRGPLGTLGADLHTGTRGHLLPGSSSADGHSTADQGHHIRPPTDQGRHSPPLTTDIHIDLPGQHGNNMGEESLHLPPGMKISDLTREQLIQLGILPPDSPNVIRSGGRSTRPVTAPPSTHGIHGGSIPSNTNTGGHISRSAPAASSGPPSGISHSGDHTGLLGHLGIPGRSAPAASLGPHSGISHSGDHTGLLGHLDIPSIPTSSQHGSRQSGSTTLDHAGLFGHHDIPQSTTGVTHQLPADRTSTAVDQITSLMGHHKGNVIGIGRPGSQTSTAVHPAFTPQGIIVDTASNIRRNPELNNAVFQSVLGHHPTGTSSLSGGGGGSDLLGSILTSASSVTQPRPSSSSSWTSRSQPAPSGSPSWTISSISQPVPTGSVSWTSVSQPVHSSSPSLTVSSVSQPVPSGSPSWTVSSISQPVPPSSSSWSSISQPIPSTSSSRSSRRGQGLDPNYHLERAFRTLFL